jgi:hypothetical protein
MSLDGEFGVGLAEFWYGLAGVWGLRDRIGN